MSVCQLKENIFSMFCEKDFLGTNRGPWAPGRWPAPDGGWGWMVVLGSGLVFMVTIGPMGSFGLIFGAFLENIGAGTSDVTFINGLFFALAFLPGVLANRVLQLYTCRQVTVVGGIFYFFGCFLSSFSNSVAYMVITFSIIQGTGLGLLLPASFTCINHYFLRRRTCAMGAAQLMAAVGVMLYPLLIEKLLETYGFRSTQVILSALSLNTIAGAMTMKPLDSSVLLQRRKTFERSIENQLRRKSIISIRSVRLKTDNDGGRKMSTDDDSGISFIAGSRSEEIPLREGTLQFNTNCNMITESILEEIEEEDISGSQPLLDGHRSKANLNNKSELFVEDTKLNVRPQSTPEESSEKRNDACVSNGVRNEEDNILEFKQEANHEELPSEVYHLTFNGDTLQYIDDNDVSENINLRPTNAESFGINNQSLSNSPLKQINDIQAITNATKTPIPPRRKLVTNSETNIENGLQISCAEGVVKGESNDAQCNGRDCSSIYTESGHKTTDTQLADSLKVGAYYTVRDVGIALKVPTINVKEVPNLVIEDCVNKDSIRRVHSAIVLGQYSQRDTDIPAPASYNDLNEENCLQNAPSLTAFTKDYPNYKTTYERTSCCNRNEYLYYPQIQETKFHTIGGRQGRANTGREIIKSRSASNIRNPRQLKLNVAFSDAPDDRYYSRERNPHEVHPCFYDNSAVVPTQHGVVFQDEISPMKPLLRPSSQPHNQMSASFEFLSRFPPPPRIDKRRPSAMTTISVRSSKGRGGGDSDSDSIGSSEEARFRPALRERKQSVISWTADCLDLELLKDVIYVNIIVGVSFSLFSDNMFFNLQPLYYLSLGFSGTQVAVCIAVNSAADLVGRLIFVLCSFCLTYKSRILFLLASTATIVFRIAFLLVTDYLSICVLTALLGFFRSWINVCIPLIFAEYSPVDRFPAAYGLHLLTAGLVHLLVGPFVGLIRDVSGSYIACFSAITGCLAICVVPWIAEALVFRLSSVLKISS